jgi:hypothetical protein
MGSMDAQRQGRYACEPSSLRLGQSAVALMICGAVFGIAAAASPAPWRYAVVAIGAPATVWSVVRGWRIGLWVDEGRVRVCNYWRTFEFSAADVTDVSVGSKPAGDLFSAWIHRGGWWGQLMPSRMGRARAADVMGLVDGA